MVGLLYGSKWFAWRFQEIFPRSTLSFPLSRHLTYHYHHRRRRHPHHHPYWQYQQYHHCIMVVECPTDQKLCWYVKNVKNRTQMLKIELGTTAVKNSFQRLFKRRNPYFCSEMWIQHKLHSSFFSGEEMDKSHPINISSVSWQSKNIKKSLL